ncbi:MAG: chorismate mutase [Eubacteriales bacterium]|nr:chorismate mutase [Eubacteriales bacterium]
MESLEECRKEIDAIDKVIVEKFCERIRVASKIAEWKKANGVAVRDPEREAAKLDQVASMVPDDMAGSVVKLYNTMMELAREHETEVISEEDK